jgi:hypothetical protein
MKATFIINIEIDEGLVELDAKRWARSPERILAEVLADVEGLLVDSVRFRDCVQRVGSELLAEPQAVRQ